MRDRENSGSRPYGGIQSDDMGLGKTGTPPFPTLLKQYSDQSPVMMVYQYPEEINYDCTANNANRLPIYLTAKPAISLQTVQR